MKKPKLRPLIMRPQKVRERFELTAHAKRKIKRRMGTGTSPLIIARRCWERKQKTPPHWYYPHRGSRETSIFYKYGDCVFVFKKMPSGEIRCITIFGPYLPDGSWWQEEVLKRTG